MEGLKRRVAVRGKVRPLHTITATLPPKRALSRQVKNSTCGVIKSEEKESECVASAIPLGVDLVVMCRGVAGLVGKRKAANDYLYTSFGELKRMWVVGVAPFAYAFASEVNGKGTAVAANIAQPKFFAG